jgi:hypothetical protein
LDLATVSILCVIAFAINLPFGYWRVGVPRYSWKWFLAIHFPIPFVVVLRLTFDQGWRAIPFLFAAAIAGQLFGSYMRVARKTPRRS